MNEARRSEWKATIENPKYKPHLANDDDEVLRANRAADSLHKPHLVANEEEWRSKLEEVKAYIDVHHKAPSNRDKNSAILQLAHWIGTQKKSYASTTSIMKNEAIRAEWKATIDDPRYAPYLVIDKEEVWRKNLAAVKAYIDEHKKAPSSSDKNNAIKSLGKWVSHQKTNYDKRVDSMTNDAILAEWEATLDDPRYAKSLAHSRRPRKHTAPKVSARPDIRDSKQLETAIPSIALIETEPSSKSQCKQSNKKQQRTLTTSMRVPPDYDSTPCDETPHHLPHRPYPDSSPIGTLHKTYKRMRSDTLHATFRRNPQLWHEYHAERKRNFATYDPSSIPCNRVIQELDKIRTSRRKVVVDMGCGDACIAHHFAAKSDHRFQFHNYDHQSGGDPTITEVDMSNLPLGDASAEIVILSLALWGTRENCEQYIQEAHRVLESGGRFYIIDTTKRWSPEPLTTENAGELLREMLTLRGFGILSEDVGVPFCLFMCNRSY